MVKLYMTLEKRDSADISLSAVCLMLAGVAKLCTVLVLHGLKVVIQLLQGDQGVAWRPGDPDLAAGTAHGGLFA